MQIINTPYCILDSSHLVQEQRLMLWENNINSPPTRQSLSQSSQQHQHQPMQHCPSQLGSPSLHSILLSHGTGSQRYRDMSGTTDHRSSLRQSPYADNLIPSVVPRPDLHPYSPTLLARPFIKRIYNPLTLGTGSWFQVHNHSTGM
jgi:hypothetical protein